MQSGRQRRQRKRGLALVWPCLWRAGLLLRATLPWAQVQGQGQDQRDLQALRAPRALRAPDSLALELTQQAAQALPSPLTCRRLWMRMMMRGQNRTMQLHCRHHLLHLQASRQHSH